MWVPGRLNSDPQACIQAPYSLRPHPPSLIGNVFLRVKVKVLESHGHRMCVCVWGCVWVSTSKKIMRVVPKPQAISWIVSTLFLSIASREGSRRHSPKHTVGKVTWMNPGWMRVYMEFTSAQPSCRLLGLQASLCFHGCEHRWSMDWKLRIKAAQETPGDTADYSVLSISLNEFLFLSIMVLHEPLSCLLMFD